MVTDRSPREQIAIRLSATGLAEVKRLAAVETDGNVSLMIRKLLTEALTARAAKETRR